jgi:hypothetical protein
MTYQEFLCSKTAMARVTGYDGPLTLNPNLKPHASDIAVWMIRGGNRACFASFGLHKTSIQLEVLEQLIFATDGDGLIVAPLGVRLEFAREAAERGFRLCPLYVRNNGEYLAAKANGQKLFITNYERVRDGHLDPNQFTIVTLDEASVLRSFGSKTYQEFLPLFANVPYKFVATATPSPNRFKELIHYAGFLGVMDTGQALTRFFKRDSLKAGNLTIHPHKEREFYLWVSTWAVFITKPSDLGHSDEGYILPPLNIHRHRLPVDHSSAGFDSWGQGKLLRNAAVGVSDGAREKRDSLAARVQRTKEIVNAGPERHWLIWHDLEDERHAIQEALPNVASVYGSQDMDEREAALVGFADGTVKDLSTKLSIAGSGSNFQRHCFSMIYAGIGFKFNDFIQGVHRVQRFGQNFTVELHLIYTESEDPVYEELMRKWREHDELQGRMSLIIRGYGLNHLRAGDEMRRSIWDFQTSRAETKGDLFNAVNADNVMETAAMPDDSVDLIVTSWPFSDHYEYTESYNDFGHNDGDDGFFRQMEYLTPELMRIIKPGRMYCVHAKDRIRYGSATGLGMYSVNRFSDKCADHLERHGFIFCGRITVVTDVVRENNQTYRLGWSENAKDGTKMGVGSPEYILLFRKLPTDRSNSYADTPVVKSKDEYTRARWQFDAHSFWRSRGDRFFRPEEIAEMPMDRLRELWRQYSVTRPYDFGEHVSIAQAMEVRGILPSTFMALDPPNSGADYVWDDVTRMRTLNGEQSRKGWEQHVCPLQFDIVERLIERYSNKGDLVLDPFGGIGTVGYMAIGAGRRGYSIELNPDYHRDAVSYMKAAEQKVSMPTLFDDLDAETTGVAT